MACSTLPSEPTLRNAPSTPVRASTGPRPARLGSSSGRPAGTGVPPKSGARELDSTYREVGNRRVLRTALAQLNRDRTHFDSRVLAGLGGPSSRCGDRPRRPMDWLQWGNHCGGAPVRSVPRRLDRNAGTRPRASRGPGARPPVPDERAGARKWARSSRSVSRPAPEWRLLEVVGCAGRLGRRRGACSSASGT